MSQPKTKSRRYKCTLSIETITALREAMHDHLTEEPKDKWFKDYTSTISDLDKIINRHKQEKITDGHE